MRPHLRDAARACVAGIAALLLLVAAAARGADEAADPRLPVPDAEARAAAIALVRKEFADEFRSKGVAIRRKLVRALIDRAAAAEPAARYAMLDEAATVAEEVRDVRLAAEAALRLGDAFLVDGAARALAAADVITRAAKEASAQADAAAVCVDLAGRALAANEPATAASAIAAAKRLATSAKVGGLAARAAELTDLVAAFRKQATAAEAARAVLAATPEDAAANEAVGRHIAFGRGDFAGGLPLLARSADAGLKEAAALELKRADDVASRGALADAWWRFAQKEKDPLARARATARAAGIYEALPDDAPAELLAAAQDRVAAVTWTTWSGGVALTKDFGKAGPAQFALAAIRDYIEKKKIDRNAPDWRTKLPKFPEVTFAPGDTYVWTIETNVGDIAIRLFHDSAPNHVANFLYLTELGFFERLVFHRVIPGFMAQGGCPKKDGSGNPGYMFASEFDVKRKHDKAGVLSMANTGEPSTDGSQFFITFAPADNLDGKHTVFGEVVSGLAVVRKLEEQGTPTGVPKSPLVIEHARITVR